MLLVIFGAGASYDSVPAYLPGTHVRLGDPLNDYYRPPLANELFADRQDFAETIMRFPQCEPIVPRLRTLKDESLEAALQDLQAKAVDYPRGLQQLAAVRYYLQYIIWGCGVEWRKAAKGVTNYKTLLDPIERANRKNERVCLVTFNYDTLLEDALSDFGLPISALADYTKGHPFYRVFKVHGSINWGRLIENQIQSRDPSQAMSVVSEWIQRAAELRVTDDYIFSNECPIAVVGGRPAIPAIAIPVEREKNFECPPYLLEELIALLPQTTKVLVIGWRATEDHFLGLLKTHLKPGVRLHVVAGGLKDAEESMVRICRALTNNRPDHATAGDEGFSDFIVSGAAERFLQS